jgi:CRISPR/Cas system-associated endonuclease/helicase Cas3
MRIALSCLADGDHTNTAIHYGEYPKEEKNIELLASKRLLALDEYVSSLTNNGDERSILRSEMYQVCRNSKINGGIASCDSPVGTGKTTAIMAHLLAQADELKLRRIIVVLPFTNIITQSVEVYRKALVLDGENPEYVVAELHHRAEFQDAKSRHLTALWKAPIIVTTAVTFFETIASNTPSTLRRLHNLPGSALFVDESHAALPAKLLPLAWHWMKLLAQEWNCYWVLASGSLSRFWEISEFDKAPLELPQIVNDEFRGKLINYESGRVIYRYCEDAQNAEELVQWISLLPGPRIVVLNTVQSAAVVALEYKKRFGREKVEHLSTALTPVDRTKTLKRVKERLIDNKDTAWALIATSCVEAGMDISFRTGIRELGSFVSLLQIAGRVNRNGALNDSEVWTIRLRDEGLLKQHPGLKDAAHVLKQFHDSNQTITPSLCTEALKREIRMAGEELEKLLRAEQEMRFPQVENEFKVIKSDTRTVIINDDISKRIENFERVEWREIQNNSVQIWGYKLNALEIVEINGKPGVHKWTLAYDVFIGYMAGVLTVEEFTKGLGGAWII